MRNPIDLKVVALATDRFGPSESVVSDMKISYWELEKELKSKKIDVKRGENNKQRYLQLMVFLRKISDTPRLYDFPELLLESPITFNLSVFLLLTVEQEDSLVISSLGGHILNPDWISGGNGRYFARYLCVKGVAIVKIEQDGCIIERYQIFPKRDKKSPNHREIHLEKLNNLPFCYWDDDHLEVDGKVKNYLNAIRTAHNKLVSLRQQNAGPFFF